MSLYTIVFCFCYKSTRDIAKLCILQVIFNITPLQFSPLTMNIGFFLDLFAHGDPYSAHAAASPLASILIYARRLRAHAYPHISSPIVCCIHCRADLIWESGICESLYILRTSNNRVACDFFTPCCFVTSKNSLQ